MQFNTKEDLLNFVKEAGSLSRASKKMGVSTTALKNALTRLGLKFDSKAGRKPAIQILNQQC